IALADEGVAIVFISSELEEVVRLSDRIIVLKDRRKLADLTVDETVTTDSLIATIAEEPAPAGPGSPHPAGTGVGS
ncbi:MAG: sugar ABC transporter ATP-binding protein, partial [Brachybacterium sp.]|nr:sugar ABC transporter ATP-binding protein [Brachybacterium sp.]